MTKSRCSSARCAIDTIDSRGRPSAARSIFPTSSGSPCRQVSNEGEARRLLSAIIRDWRSFFGNAVSSGSAPILSKGGSAIWPISDSSERPFPARQAFSTSVARKMACGDCSGSASVRTRASRPATTDWISSRRSSSAESKETPGASSDCSTFSGTPAFDPGVKMTASWFARRAATSCGPRPHSARPFFARSDASAAAFEAPPAARATSGSIQGSKEAGARSSKSSSRLARSPFGSIAMTPVPWRSTSSTSTTARPVFPEPVMPTISPCVSRSDGSSRTGSPVLPFASTSRPRYSPFVMSPILLTREYIRHRSAPDVSSPEVRGPRGGLREAPALQAVADGRTAGTRVAPVPGDGQRGSWRTRRAP